MSPSPSKRAAYNDHQWPRQIDIDALQLQARIAMVRASRVDAALVGDDLLVAVTTVTADEQMSVTT